MPEAPLTAGLTPSEASPVLVTQLAIQLDSTWTEGYDPADFHIELISGDGLATPIKDIQIIDIDATNKIVNVAFPGHYSGDYFVRVNVAGTRAEWNSLALKVHGTVTAIANPLGAAQGSNLGGTLVTIDGSVFGNEITDNPVKIGDQYCYVQTTNSN